MELLLSFYTPVEQPAVTRIFALTVRWFGTPTDVPPEIRLVECCGPEDRAGVDTIIEEHDQGRPPVVADSQRLLPAPRPLKFVRGEVEGIQVRLREIVPTSDVTLWLRLWEPRQFFQEVLLPGPRQDRPQVLAGLVRRASGVGSAVCRGLLVDPVEEVPKVNPANLVDIYPFPPGGPLVCSIKSDRRSLPNSSLFSFLASTIPSVKKIIDSPGARNISFFS